MASQIQLKVLETGILAQENRKRFLWILSIARFLEFSTQYVKTHGIASSFRQL